jgi:hypothetical protein
MNGSQSFGQKFGLCARSTICQETDVVAFEKALHRELPVDYRNFLLKWNYCQFDRLVGFPLLDSLDEFGTGNIRLFFGLFEPGHIEDLRRSGEGYGFNKCVPGEYLAIGSGESWDTVCISLGGDDFGHIYWWEPGEPWKPGDTQTRQFLRPVAGSFSDFWNVLFDADALDSDD